MRIAVLLLILTLPVFGARNYDETDTDAAQCDETEALAVSTETTACGATINKLAEDSGTAGTSEVQLTIAAAGQCMCGWFESEDVNDTSWASGAGNIRIEVTSADTATWVNYDIARVSADCSTVLDGNVDNATGLSHSLNSTGVRTQATSWASQTAGATDLWIITWGCTGDGLHGNETPGITPSQLIDTPLDALAAGRTRTVVADD